MALLLVQPVIVLVAHVIEGPQVVLGYIGGQNSLVRGAIQTGVALEIGTEFAQASSRGQHLLH
jgi:type IV secretory pathway TrbL component